MTGLGTAAGWARSYAVRDYPWYTLVLISLRVCISAQCRETEGQAAFTDDPEGC